MAPRFDTESQRLHQAHQRLTAALEAVGAAWGDDRQGVEFGTAFTAHQERLDQTLRTLREGLASIGPGLRTMADNYEQAAQSTRFRP